MTPFIKINETFRCSKKTIFPHFSCGGMTMRFYSAARGAELTRMKLQASQGFSLAAVLSSSLGQNERFYSHLLD